jgi:hypothetical protein
VGVGRQLLGELTGLAARRGVRTLTATVQPGNRPVLRLIDRLLPDSAVRPDGDVLAVSSPLGAPAEPVSRRAPQLSLLAAATH